MFCKCLNWTIEMFGKCLKWMCVLFGLVTKKVMWRDIVDTTFHASAVFDQHMTKQPAIPTVWGKAKQSVNTLWCWYLNRSRKQTNQFVKYTSLWDGWLFSDRVIDTPDQQGYTNLEEIEAEQMALSTSNCSFEHENMFAMYEGCGLLADS